MGVEQRARAASTLKHTTQMQEQAAALATQQAEVTKLRAELEAKLAEIDEARKGSSAEGGAAVGVLNLEAKALQDKLDAQEARLNEALEAAKDATQAQEAAEAATARQENVAAAVSNFTRRLADHENAEKEHEGPIELEQLAPRFDAMAPLLAVALEEMGGSFATTTAELAELIGAMDEEKNTTEKRQATLEGLGGPKAHVLTCAQCKELLGAIKGEKASSERMIAVENCGPRVNDPKNAEETILPFFRTADEVSHLCADSRSFALRRRSPTPLFTLA